MTTRDHDRSARSAPSAPNASTGRTRRLVVVSAGLGQPSSTRLLADRLDAATTAALRDLEVDATSEIIELRDHAHDLTDHLLTGFASERLQDAKDAVARADGVVAVTPIFSASYNGLFKTFFDVLDDGALEDVPVLMGATAGTARHSLALEHALRPLFGYLRASVVPTAVFAASEDWGAGRGIEGGLAARIDRAGAQLAGMVARNQPRRAADPLVNPTPFARLLQAG
jgi:FMN reductase